MQFYATSCELSKPETHERFERCAHQLTIAPDADNLHLAKPGGWCAVALVCCDSSLRVFFRAWSSNLQLAHAGLITSLEPQASWAPLIWWHDMAGLPVRYCSQIISPFGGMGLLATLHMEKKLH